MSQHDFNIANQTFSATRTDINNAYGALATNSAGNSAPSTTYANQWWFDSDGNQLYMRNKDNDAWVKVFSIGATSDVISGATYETLGIGADKDLGVGIHIKSADSGASVSGDADELVIEGSANSGLSILSGTGNAGRIYFGDSGDNDVGQITYAHDDNALSFITNGAFRMRINGDGDVGLGTASPSNVGSGRTLHIKGHNSDGANLRLEGENDTADSNDMAIIKNDSEGIIKIFGSDKFKINMNNAVRFLIDGDGKVGIGATTPAQQLSILKDHNADTAMRVSNGTAGTGARSSIFLDVDGGGAQLMAVNASFSTSGAYIADNVTFVSDTAMSNGMTIGTRSSDAGAHIRFFTQDSESARIEGGGTFLVGKTSSGLANAGCELATDKLSATVSAATIMYLNRLTNDGTIAQFHQAGTEEGSIEVSGSTVSYNGFTGSHWSRLADNSKPTILRGTIMESIDEMCDWYQAVADVPEVLWTIDDPETQNVLYTADDVETQDVLYTEEDELPEGIEVGDVKEPAKKSVGDVKETATQTVGEIKQEAITIKESIPLGEKSVGDAITFTSNGTEYTGTIVKEDDVKHTKCKVSDTADSKKVYGVFSNWDDADDGLDGDVNDMNIAQVGTFIVRVNVDVTVEAGDLLVSNGDGTAKVQDDDIIRSKTVAKVNSTVKIETYADGSYTVPCTLHC